MKLNRISLAIAALLLTGAAAVSAADNTQIRFRLKGLVASSASQPDTGEIGEPTPAPEPDCIDPSTVPSGTGSTEFCGNVGTPLVKVGTSALFETETSSGTWYSACLGENQALPSRDEMYTAYAYYNVSVKLWDGYRYWTRDEVDANHAWSVLRYSNSGGAINPGSTIKTGSLAIRCIRTF